VQSVKLQTNFFVITEVNNFVATSKNYKALQTFHQVHRFSRKLQRRLTQHTVAEVKAVRQYSEDALRFVLYTAELVGNTSNYMGEQVIRWTLPGFDLLCKQSQTLYNHVCTYSTI
jgi:hypothetical protein